MVTKPVSQGLLLDATRGHTQNKPNDIGLRGLYPVTVQAQEDIHHLEGYALVAIHKRMVACQPVAVSGRDPGQVGAGLVSPPVARALERRFEQTFIAQSERSSVLTNLVDVDGQHHSTVDPAGLLPLARHRASSRMAFR